MNVPRVRLWPVLLAVWGLLLGAPLGAQDLELRFLDVGQGDAVLIRSGGKAALIDTGPSNRIVDQLRALGIDSLDLLIASHNHADHIGGADAVLAAIPVRFYLDNGVPATTDAQSRVLRAVEARGVGYLEATLRTIRIGDATLRILPAPAGVTGDEQNNRSVVALLEMGSFRALLPGDAEVELLGTLLERYDLPDVDVLKAAHHGSRNGVTPAWLSRVRPEVVVISLGADNTYGHPHSTALRYYAAGGRRVLRTDQDGDVVISVTPSGCYEVRTETRGVLPALRSAAPKPSPSAVPQASPPARSPSCCRVCQKGKACGDSCISRSYTCRKPPGCACNG